MDAIAFSIVAVAFLAFALVSRPLENSPLTSTMLFVALGVVLGPLGSGLVTIDITHRAVELLAELTLAVVLFSDAARIDLANLRTNQILPVRMLTIGLPGVMIAGTAVGLALFPQWSFCEVALLAALLAPTDAALGQAVMSHPSTPVRIRQTLNVESGLNDGIALPAVLFIATCAAAAHDEGEIVQWILIAAKQLGLSPLIGLAVGLGGGWLVARAGRKGWMTQSSEALSSLAVAALAFLCADLAGANGFISVFTAGMALGYHAREHCGYLFAFAEAEGQFMVLATFFVFGLALLPLAVQHVHWTFWIYAALSLSVVRMVPISLSLAGTGLSAASHLFLGWFGPRGLATVLFTMLIVSRAAIPHREEIVAVAMGVVALSVLAHGLSAAPAARLYGARCAAKASCPENAPVPEMRLRHSGNFGRS